MLCVRVGAHVRSLEKAAEGERGDVEGEIGDVEGERGFGVTIDVACVRSVLFLLNHFIHSGCTTASGS